MATGVVAFVAGATALLLASVAPGDATILGATVLAAALGALLDRRELRRCRTSRSCRRWRSSLSSPASPSSPSTRALSPARERFLAPIPVAAFAALVVQGLADSDGTPAPCLVAAGVVVLVVLRSRQLGIALVAGMTAFWVAELAVGQST